MTETKLIAAFLLVGALLWANFKTDETTAMDYENLPGGPNYIISQATQATVAKWSSAALFEQGYLQFSADGSGTHFTAKYFALPVV